MELRDLRCLAAAFVALDKPNASKKALFRLWTERTALEISHLRCLPAFVTLGKLKNEKKAPFLSLDLIGIKIFALFRCCLCSS